MSDQPGKPENGDSAGEPAIPEPVLVDSDDVRLADPEVSDDALEPDLDTPAEAVTLTEPSLEPAEISAESADAASLGEAASEAEAVAQEADEVGTLVGGPQPQAEADVAGTAPAGGKAGDVPPAITNLAASGDEPGWTASQEDQERWDALFEEGQAIASQQAEPPAAGAPATDAGGPADDAGAPADDDAGAPAGTEGAPASPWAQPFPSPKPAAQAQTPVGGPYGFPPAGASAGEPGRAGSRRATRSNEPKKSGRSRLIVVAVAVLVVALLIFAIVRIVDAVQGSDPGAGPSANTTPGADGIIAENLSPLQLATGDCIRSFDSANVSANVTTVTCTTPHNAQLLATTSLPAEAEFPGEESLGASGDELCNAVQIDETAAADYSGLTLTQVTPTSRTWAEGDRRLDCFVVSDEGNVITDTLLAR
ncbi:hypothetical protein GC088_12480 [Arthrobacter sp. JZ12]|uniref:septum formation family protein n=1 Tax=Arthrobacter sp. JZ12 TaxID=2654190 RepID=UPI002B48813F|nr:septum formation family protein [Arthrobacter sp. JZ12]WRH25804.1 hypothetical protein GC088_12480 [Arthrobacter sp. JZ12]